MSAEKGLSEVNGHEKNTQEGSSTSNLETSAIADKCKTEETEGGGEGTKVVVDEGAEEVMQSVTENDGGHAGRSDKKGVSQSRATLPEATEDIEPEETETDVKEEVYLTEEVHKEGQDERHVVCKDLWLPV